MTRRNKRFLSLLLALTLAVSLCVLPAAAADRTCPSSKSDPVVFVHGLMGWGERAGLNSVLPYWGMTTGSLTAYLNSLGYETYSATVGPISSAWDRACELYAQLTGTTVDYGAAHSAAHDHARYGITYDRPLFDGWGTRRAVNLVGHSFGGATTRLFLELMANGSAEEVAAAKAAGTAPSPLFTGGKSSWVHSMTEVAAPHNGTSFIESNGTIMDVSTNLAETLAKGFGITELKNLLDFQLEQFGIYKDPDETVLETLQRVLSTDFLSHNDNAFLDLTIDKSLEINDGIGIEPNVYYFSYAGNQTVQDPVSGNYIPSARMWTLFYPGAYNMGKYYDKYTAGGFYIDKSWRPNDGMVNTVSAFYPIHSDGTCLTKDGKQGWTNTTAIPASISSPASGTSCPCSRLTTSSSSAACSTAASSRHAHSTAASWRTSTAPIPPRRAAPRSHSRTWPSRAGATRISRSCMTPVSSAARALRPSPPPRT